MAHSRGLTIPWEFSARELFQKMAATLEPIPEMIAAVMTLRTAGMDRGVTGGPSSLVPRPSPAPVFARFQYAKTEPEGLVNLTT